MEDVTAEHAYVESYQIHFAEEGVGHHADAVGSIGERAVFG
jgi:hypothetical protein